MTSVVKNMGWRGILHFTISIFQSSMERSDVTSVVKDRGKVGRKLVKSGSG